MPFLICPECNASISANRLFCPECGCPMDYIKAHNGRHNALGIDAESENRQISVVTQNLSGSTKKPPSFAPQQLRSLFSRFENLIVFDVETNGLHPATDQIIELAALKVCAEDGKAQITDTFSELICLQNGQYLSAEITRLTGISFETLQRTGKTPEEVCRQFSRLLIPEKTLMIAYNAHFDMSFLRSFMYRCGASNLYQGLHALDALTVYKDRRDYPHKLSDAIEAYHLNGVKNSHRAINDAELLLRVLLAMDQEHGDLGEYIDLFGYNPKWGISGARLPSIRYVAQPYDSRLPLYV